MKKIVTLFMLVFCINYADAEVKVMVDERIEFTSIVWGLAGAPEYGDCDTRIYKDDIDSCFSEHAWHPLMPCIAGLLYGGLGYATVPASALMMEISDGRIQIQDKYRENNSLSSLLHDNWSIDNFEHYVSLLDDYYQKSGFRSFYNSHKGIYDKAVSCVDSIVEQNMDSEWFKSIFGEEFDSIDIYLSINNARHNYSCGTGIVPSIVLGVSLDEEGNISGKESVFGIVIHELMHRYVDDDMIDDKFTANPTSVETIFDKLSPLLYQGAYGEKNTMVSESLTRLFTDMYSNDHENADEARRMALRDEESGFIWQGDLLKFLLSNRQRRAGYDIDEMMMDISAYFDSLAYDIDNIYDEWIERHPKVVEVKEDFSDNDSLVYMVTFSDAMSQGVAIGIGTEKRLPLSWWGKNPYSIQWISEYAFILKFSRKMILPYGFTSFSFIKDGIYNKNGYTLIDNYNYTVNHENF